MNKNFFRGFACGIICAGFIIVGIWFGKEFITNQIGLAQSKDNETLVEKVDDKLQILQAYINSYYWKDVDEDKLAESVLKGVVEGLGDPYSVYYTSKEYQQLLESVSGTYCGIGATVTQSSETGIVTILNVIKGSPAEKAGLKAEDILYKVGDSPVTSSDLSDTVAKMKGEPGTKVSIEIVRGSEHKKMDIMRSEIEVDTVSHTMLKDDIGYIRVASFEDTTPKQFRKAVEDLDEKGQKGMIIDIRNNGGGSLAAVVDMMDFLLPEGKTVYTKDKTGVGQEFFSTDKEKFTKPMAVLINGSSASASEVFAGALQDFKTATLIGTQSFGKGIVQSIIPVKELNDGSAIKLTTSEYFLPSGRSIHKKGLTPDIIVELKKDKETDNQLEQAIKCVQDKIK